MHANYKKSNNWNNKMLQMDMCQRFMLAGNGLICIVNREIKYLVELIGSKFWIELVEEPPRQTSI